MAMTYELLTSHMTNCNICPRKCGVNRLTGQTGFCNQTFELKGARAALHYWEEPCISGHSGSGAVFFSGCNLRCCFCQNHIIAAGNVGKAFSPDRLSDIFLELQDKGANNINLVTPTHFIPQIVYALEKAKNVGLSIPIVYNTGNYESLDSLKMLDGLIDIYLPDMKYLSTTLSSKYSSCPDYFDVACISLSEMFRQVGPVTFSGRYDGDIELLDRGIIVRHLCLPGQVKDTKKILRFLHDNYKDDIYVSIMNQYTPMPQVSNHPELDKKLSPDEYSRIINFADAIGINRGFIQEGDVASESFIPDFSGDGI